MPAPDREFLIFRLLSLDSKRLTPWQLTLLALAGTLTLFAPLLSLGDVQSDGGIDLRNRVVGARVWLSGSDPYTFTWRPGDSERMLDPLNYLEEKLHRLTAPPTAIGLYAPPALLPYRAIRLIHFSLEWLALCVSIVLLTRTLPNQRLRVWFVAGAAVFFVFGDFWRLHVDRGQLYAFHLALLSAGVALSLRHNLDSWTAGMAFGLVAALRPNFLVLVPAFLVIGKFRTAAATIVVCGVAVLLTLPGNGIDIWKSYLRTGELYYLYTWAPERVPVPALAKPPMEAEGYGFLYILPGARSVSFARCYALLGPDLGLPAIDLGLVSKIMLAYLALVLLVLLFLGRKRNRSPRLTLALIAVFLLDSEYFLPERWPYVDIMFLLPLALLLPVLAAPLAVSRRVAFLVLLGLIIGQGLLLHSTLDLPARLRSFLVMGGLTGLLLWVWSGRLPGRGPKSILPVHPTSNSS